MPEPLLTNTAQPPEPMAAAVGSRVGRGVIYRTMRLGGSGAAIQRNAIMTRPGSSC